MVTSAALPPDIAISPLFNADLAPTPQSRRTWTTYNFAALWIAMAHCLPTYMLAGGLIALGMNWWQALLTIALGNLIVLIPILLNAHPGTKYGIPFPVLARSPNTVIGLPSAQGQKQADVLNSFCANQQATCSFTSRSFDNAAWAAPVQSSDLVRNNTTSNLTTTITVTNTQSTATSLKLSTSVKAKVFEVVEVSVTAEASQTWTSTYTFSQAITLTAKPGEEVYVESSAPVKAVTGDFTVSFGNTTFNLYDVTFDSPDTDRRLRYDAIAVPIPSRV